MTIYYQNDLITLYHGSCLETDEWLDAQVLITDPPYGIAWKASHLHWRKSERLSATQSITSDEDTAMRDLALQMWGDKSAIVFGSWRKPRPEPCNHRLIWHKANRWPGVSPHPFYPVDEEIYIIGNDFIGKPLPSVITTHELRSAQPKLIGHPTPKPIGLMTVLVEKTVGTIADPFAGSGATLIAARNLGRSAVGVEIDEKYCEIIAKRLDQMILEYDESSA